MAPLKQIAAEEQITASYNLFPRGCMRTCTMVYEDRLKLTGQVACKRQIRPNESRLRRHIDVDEVEIPL
ncbi:MAG: hypothetical protein VR75_00300 [Hyphomonadaceae bacterium BRH_c29]|nr:MAG: hypothetical protein VR75_00300 [Hyphomonadaceae bacterium BRH_c29]